MFPTVRPWYLSPWHYFFLKKYFSGSKSFEDSWLEVYSGYVSVEPSLMPVEEAGIEMISPVEGGEGGDGWENEGAPTANSTKISNDEPPAFMTKHQIVRVWHFNVIVLAFQVSAILLTSCFKSMDN
jgi:hypothetical protein